MRILIAANHNTGSYTPFIIEQVEAIKQLGVEFDYFGIHGKGIMGYLSNRSALKKKIREYHPDLIHAHYGLSGLLANLQRKVPVVTTYHGSDIHSGGRALFFSRLSTRLSAYNIFVSNMLMKQSGYNGENKCAIPCGVNLNTFQSIDRQTAKKMLGWDENGKHVLFAGSFNNAVKNSPLAKAATALVEGAQLMELRGYTREQVNYAMNAADCFLLTSHREGSPQVIKEAMCCGTPIVTVPVGDVEEALEGVDNCYVATYDANEIAACIRKALSFKGKTNGRQHIIDHGLSNELVADRVKTIYEQVLNMR